MTTHLVWFRNDLRITDNRALDAACQDGDAHVMALFIATPRQWARHDMAPRQGAFLLDNLHALREALAEKGIPLFYHQCPDFSAATHWLVEFCRSRSVDRLFYNHQYEVNERELDRQVEETLGGRVDCRGFHDGLLLPPGSVQTGAREMYKVFTPFRQAFIARLQETDIRSLPAPDVRRAGALDASQAIMPFDYPRREYGDEFPAGEAAALRRLRVFCREQVQDYQRQRDMPALAGTSRLSPYLAIGVLSPRQCVNRLRAECPALIEQRESGAFGCRRRISARCPRPTFAAPARWTRRRR